MARSYFCHTCVEAKAPRIYSSIRTGDLEAASDVPSSAVSRCSKSRMLALAPNFGFLQLLKVIGTERARTWIPATLPHGRSLTSSKISMIWSEKHFLGPAISSVAILTVLAGRATQLQRKRALQLAWD
jgi:hypothetical protein